MPTVLRENGYRFLFYASDRNEPKHVHVIRGDGYGKVWLEPMIRVQYLVDFKMNEKREIMEIIKRYTAFLNQQWDEFFNEYV